MVAMETAIQEAASQTVEPPDVEFVGEYRQEFAELMARNLCHVTNDNEGRRYRLVKLVFEELE